MFTDKLARYSNTLLVSLNNRISIRNAVAGTPIASRSTAITFAVTPRSDSGIDISHLEGGGPQLQISFNLAGMYEYEGVDRGEYGCYWSAYLRKRRLLAY